MAVDTMGLPHAIAVTTANITDRIGAISMVNLHRETLMFVLKLLDMSNN